VQRFRCCRAGNVKKLVAFSSIEHMGFLLVGIGLGTPLAAFLGLVPHPRAPRW